MAENKADIAVIGAGMAGLTAARALTEAGLQVLVIEAQNRIGGRILTQHVGDEAIELGAEFIHGRPAELWALIDEAGLKTYERDGAHLSFEDGALSDRGDGMGQVFKSLEKLEGFTGQDISFAEYLDQQQMPLEERSGMIGYVEGFNAADHREISVASLGAQQKAEEAVEGDRLFHLRGGYDQLPVYLARKIEELGGRIVTESPVKEIRWQPGLVEIVTKAETLHAEKAVVTLPLGVLQNGDVSISPRPEKILTAANQLRMGQVCRFTLLFRRRFWQNLPPQPALSELSFLLAFSEMPPVWWTPHPEASNTITGWIGGPRSSALSRLDNAAAIGRQACTTLAKILGLNPDQVYEQLLDCYIHDWQQDAFTRGAYSYVAAGGLDAPRQMTEPVDATLFFAGEHTDVTGHWGTVHAAMRSGLRAAAQILSDRS